MELVYTPDLDRTAAQAFEDATRYIQDSRVEYYENKQRIEIIPEHEDATPLILQPVQLPQIVNQEQVFYDNRGEVRVAANSDTGLLSSIISKLPLERVIPGAVFRFEEGNFFRSRLMLLNRFPERQDSNKALGIRWGIGLTPSDFNNRPVFQDNNYLLRMVFKRGLAWHPNRNGDADITDELIVNYIFTDENYLNPNVDIGIQVYQQPDLMIENHLVFNPANGALAHRSLTRNSPNVDEANYLIEEDQVTSFGRKLGVKIERKGNLWWINALGHSFEVSDNLPLHWTSLISEELPPFPVKGRYY